MSMWSSLSSFLYLHLVILSYLTCMLGAAHQCVHDQIKFNPIILDVPSHHSGERALTETDYEPIRILFDYSALDGMTGVSDFLSYVQNSILPPAHNYLEAALKVRRITGNLTAQNQNSICEGTVSIPSIYNTVGVEADLVIFVTVTNEPTMTFVAYAGACVMDGATKRPIFGRLNYNLARLKASTVEGTIERDIAVTLHETTHVLGFSDSLFSYFVDPSTYIVLTGHKYSKIVNSQVVTVINVQPLTSRLQTYFGCPTLDGAYIEQEGGTGSAGSHFERRVFMNEYMTASILKELKVSAFTLAMLEGSGWYQVDYSLAEDMTYGKGKGCSFLDGYCMNSATVTPNFEEFCSPLLNVGCSWTGRGTGVCATQSLSTNSNLASYLDYWGNKTIVKDVFADNCPMIQMYSNLDCEEPANQETATLLSEEFYGQGSKCFTGTIYPGGSLSTPYGYCFKAKCESLTNSSYKVKVSVGTLVVECLSAGQITVPNHGGYLNCPDPKTFCERTIKEGLCRRKCSGRGTCTNNTCICVNGWGSHDCSKKNYADKCSKCMSGANFDPWKTSCYGDTCACNPGNITCMCGTGQTTGAACNTNTTNNNTQNTTNGTSGTTDGTSTSSPLGTITEKLSSITNIPIIIGVVIGAVLVIAVGIFLGVRHKPQRLRPVQLKVVPINMVQKRDIIRVDSPADLTDSMSSARQLVRGPAPMSKIFAEHLRGDKTFDESMYGK